MERWNGKVAVVTGASSGIGAAVVKDLIKHGVKVIGLARRLDRMEQLKQELPKDKQANFFPVKCDVTQEKEVMDVFGWAEKNLGGVDILVNNAGMMKPGLMLDPAMTDIVRQTLDLNVMAVVYCTREAFKSMKSRGGDGHVILINSIAGHQVLNFKPPHHNIYSPTKFAVTAMTEMFRQEFQHADTRVKVSSVSPGLVRTEIVPQDLYKTYKAILEPENVSDAIIYILGTPPHVQIHELTIKPVGETF